MALPFFSVFVVEARPIEEPQEASAAEEESAPATPKGPEAAKVPS